MFCTLVLCGIIIWYVAHDPKDPIRKHKHEDDFFMSSEDWRVERYIRHKARQKKPKKRL